MPADIETDPMFTLLTDALRAGPASAQWKEAVARLREGGAGEADEYQLLITAREDLEGGQEYRSVRAGAGFTRKLMERIDTQEPTGRRLSLATFVAAICGLAILGALAWLAYRVASAPGEPDRQAIEQLASESNAFFTPLADAEFNQSLPSGWKQIGSLPLTFDKGVQPAPGGGGSATAGGGIYWAQPIPAERSFTFEVTVNVGASASGVALEAFVAGSSNFSADRAISPTELDWLVRGREQQVVVDGHVTLASPSPSGRIPLRITIGREIGIIEVGQPAVDGKMTFRRLWAGTHHLGTEPRYVGVRFIGAVPAGGAGIGVEQIRAVSR